MILKEYNVKKITCTTTRDLRDHVFIKNITILDEDNNKTEIMLLSDKKEKLEMEEIN